MAQTSSERMDRLREQLQQDLGLAESLPSAEGDIVRAALEGQSVYEIAQDAQMSEEYVWRVLGAAARMAGGQPVAQPVETGGFGSDTDPGITGGYGDTGFGSLSADSDPTVLDNEQSAEFGRSQPSDTEAPADGDQTAS